MEKPMKTLIAKHHVVCAQKNGEKLEGSYRAGETFLHENEDFYVLKLAAFPFPYFLKKNRFGDSNYTIFARKRESPTGIRFQDPVGKASLGTELKSHLEITIPILNLTLYMNLYPVQ